MTAPTTDNITQLSAQLSALLSRTANSEGEAFRALPADAQEYYLSACCDIADKLANACAELNMG